MSENLKAIAAEEDSATGPEAAAVIEEILKAAGTDAVKTAAAAIRDNAV